MAGMVSVSVSISVSIAGCLGREHRGHLAVNRDRVTSRGRRGHQRSRRPPPRRPGVGIQRRLSHEMRTWTLWYEGMLHARPLRPRPSRSVMKPASRGFADRQTEDALASPTQPKPISPRPSMNAYEQGLGDSSCSLALRARTGAVIAWSRIEGWAAGRVFRRSIRARRPPHRRASLRRPGLRDPRGTPRGQAAARGIWPRRSGLRRWAGRELPALVVLGGLAHDVGVPPRGFVHPMPGTAMRRTGHICMPQVSVVYDLGWHTSCVMPVQHVR